MKIPKRLIQTARTTQLSPLAQGCATNLKLLHPDWDYIFYDDKAIHSFIDSEFPQYRSVFNAFPYNIQRIDFFRYLAIYRFGGFYFDLDVLLAKSLSPLLEYESVFPFEELTLSFYLRRQYGLDWELGNYAFGAVPGDPFLGAVIENCIRCQRDPAWVAPMMHGIPALFRKDLYVLNTTGPGLLTRTFAEQPNTATKMSVLFPQDVCNSSTWHLFGDYGIHLMDGSWRTKGNFIKRQLARLWESRIRKNQLKQSTAFGPTRTWGRLQNSIELELRH